jgi:hypothetical protein
VCAATTPALLGSATSASAVNCLHATHTIRKATTSLTEAIQGSTACSVAATTARLLQEASLLSRLGRVIVFLGFLHRLSKREIRVLPLHFHNKFHPSSHLILIEIIK